MTDITVPGRRTGGSGAARPERRPDTATRDMHSNFNFMLDTAAALARSGGRILDFGCGRGEVVAAGLARGMAVAGADTFDPAFGDLWEQAPADIRPHLHRIAGGALPFADATFDIVVSNQVFEHIADPRPAFAEIARVLRPGGAMLALFPTAENWFESHIGLYFAHWPAARPKLQRAYVGAVMRLGFGHRDADDGVDVLIARYLAFLHDHCVYHRKGDVQASLQAIFGAPPRSVAGELLRYRLGWAGGGGIAAPLLEAVSQRRLGQALLVKKAG